MTCVLPTCIDCRCHFATACNEVLVLEVDGDGQPWQVTAGDLLECPRCHKQIVSGFGTPLSKRHHDDFAHYLERVDFTIVHAEQRVEQWHRPKKEKHNDG